MVSKQEEHKKQTIVYSDPSASLSVPSPTDFDVSQSKRIDKIGQDYARSNVYMVISYFILYVHIKYHIVIIFVNKIGQAIPKDWHFNLHFLLTT